ncbi:MAG: hypothetical protein ABIF92_02075 [archaeon]
MRITVIENKKRKNTEFRGKTVADLIHSFGYSTESYVALREEIPITALDKLKAGDKITLKKVVTGA